MMRSHPDEPLPFDYWLAYLSMTDDWEAAWSQTYDMAVSEWQLELCWQLLREARRLAVSPAQQAMVRYQEGRLHAQSGDWQRAIACYEFALAHAAAEDIALQIELFNELGMMHRLRGAYQEALQTHRRHYQLARQASDLWHEAQALNQLGLDYEAAGQLEEARSSLERALLLWQQLENNSGETGTYKILGLVAWRQGRLAEAERYLQQDRQRAMAGEWFYDLAQIEGNLGNVAYERNELDVAETHYLAALTLFDQLGVIFDKFALLNNLAGIAVARDDYERAQMLYREGLALSQTLGYLQGELEALLNLTVVALRQQQWDHPPRLYKQALAVARALKHRPAIRESRYRQLRFIFLYGLLRFLGWIRRRVSVADPSGR